MHWPIQPLEIQRRFAPRFCPRRDCASHLPCEGFDYQRVGHYTRGDGRRVQRYRCSSCLRTFSKQTFSISYFLKRPDLLVDIASGIVNGAAHRQIARGIHCAPSTVTRQSARLGRHSLLLLVLSLHHLGEDREAAVLDHMESFEGCQDYPFAVATLVGKDSWYWYGIDGGTHERTGRRSEFQEAKRRLRPIRDTKGGYVGSARRLLETRLDFDSNSTSLRVICDGLEDYAKAVGVPSLQERISLTVYPNPKRGPKGAPRSAVARIRDASMFANDLLHGLLRHSMAHRHRETIAFPRRINAEMERLFLAAVWRNFVKGVSERKPDETTPAMRKKLATEPWSWERTLARRLFPDHLRVPRSWVEIYRRLWTTPTLRSNTRHELRLAY